MDLADAVQKAGYKTNSSNFRVIVNQALLANRKLFKKVARGGGDGPLISEDRAVHFLGASLAANPVGCLLVAVCRGAAHQPVRVAVRRTAPHVANSSHTRNECCAAAPSHMGPTASRTFRRYRLHRLGHGSACQSSSGCIARHRDAIADGCWRCVSDTRVATGCTHCARTLS